jgi:rhodanese-related sulfurtransferase
LKTILFDEPLKPKTAPVGFAPLGASAFRLLGLTAAATQREVFDAAASLRLALKVGVEKRYATDQDWLAPLVRTEADIRDALSRLSAPTERAHERFFWFYHPLHLAPPQTIAELIAIAENLLGETKDDSAAIRRETGALLHHYESRAVIGPEAGDADRAQGDFARRHDAALLLLAGLHRLDSACDERAAWRRAFQLWREVCDAEEFWSSLVAADLKGGFEPAVTFGEVSALRADAARFISLEVARSAQAHAAAGRAAAARRALEVLRAASLPAPLLAGYEGEIVGPFEDCCDERLLEAFSLVEYFYDPANAEASKRAFFRRALDHIEKDLKPALRNLLEIGGGASPAVRRTFAASARRILRLAEAYDGLTDGAATAAGLTELAGAIAPPASPERGEVEARLERKTVGAVEAAESSAPAASSRNEAEEYEAAALVELRRERPEWLLKDEGNLFSTPRRRSGGLISVFAIYGAVALFLFLLYWSGVFKPSRSRSSPAVGVLMNYNLPVLRPTMPPLPVMTPQGLVPRVSIAELRELLKDRRAILVDVRGRAEYEAGHLPGAVWMPDEEVPKRYRSLLRPNRRLIFYCDCRYDLEADGVAFHVRLLGKADVAVLAGGYQAWLAETAESSAENADMPPPLETTVEPPRIVEPGERPGPSPTR